MTIGSETSSVAYSGNGSTTAFATGFYFENDDDIKAYLRDADNVLTLLTAATQYTLTGAGNALGGTLTMVTPPASGETLLIQREPALTQTLDLETDNTFVPETLEKRLDRLAAQIHAIRDITSRCISVPRADLAADLEHVYDTVRAGYLLGFDGSGNVTNGPNIDDVNSLLANNSLPTASAHYATIGLAQALDGDTADGTVVFCRTYDEADDMGGGLFWYDKTSTDTADDGLIFEVTAGGRLKRLYAGPVQAEWFGAGPTRSRSDNVTRLNKAFLTAATVRLSKPGAWQFDAALLRANGYPIWCSAGVNMRPYTGVSHYVALTIEEASGGGRLGDGEWRVVMQGGSENEYDGTGTDNRPDCDGILMYTTSTLVLENFLVRHVRGFGIKINDIFDAVIHNLAVENCGTATEWGIELTGSGTNNESIINRIAAEDCYKQAVKIDLDTLNVTIGTIHSEGAYSDTVAWILGGTNVSYQNVRLQNDGISASTAQVQIEFADLCTFENLRIGSGISDVLVKGNAADDVLKINGMTGSCNFNDTTGHTGIVVLENAKLSGTTTLVSDHVDADGPITGYLVRNCHLSTVVTQHARAPSGEAEFASAKRAARIEASYIGAMSGAGGQPLVHLKDTIVAAFNINAYNYVWVEGEGSHITPTLQSGDATVKASNYEQRGGVFGGNLELDTSGAKRILFDSVYIDGNLAQANAGNQLAILRDCTYSGTVHSSFQAAPHSTAGRAGDRHDRPPLASGQTQFWKHNGSAWVAGASAP